MRPSFLKPTSTSSLFGGLRDDSWCNPTLGAITTLFQVQPGNEARIVHVFVEEHRLRFEGEDHLHEVFRDWADLDLMGEVPGES